MDRVLAALGRKKNESNQVLNRSTYSLVSCRDVAADTLQVWMGLPEEVKQDPSLELIRKKYEEIGNGEFAKATNVIEKSSFLKHVNSEPLLQAIGHTAVVKHKSDRNGEGNIEKVENIPQANRNNARPTWISKAKYYTKMTVLISCWVFFTAVFLTCPERQEVVTSTAVVTGQIVDYSVEVSNSGEVELKILGSFVSSQAQENLNTSEEQRYLEVWTHRAVKGNWSILLNEQQDRHEVRTTLLNLQPNVNHTIRLSTNSKIAVPFSISHNTSPIDPRVGVLYAVVLLSFLYVLIIFEVVNRTMAAVLVSTCALAALALVGQRPSLPEIISWLDIETLLLLFSMMILVAIMAETGIFDYLAVFTFEITQGKLWPLVYLLSFTTAVLSTFLDNVTTVLLMSPVTIRLCEVMDLDPVPILMLMAIYSNIGGTATPVGDPPNVIVASNKAVVDAGINFTNFTAHMALGIVLVCVQTSLQVKFIYRDTKKLRLRVPKDIQEITRQISIWRRAADSLPHLSSDMNVVREGLEKKIRKLNLQLEKMIKESRKRACPKDTFQTTLAQLKDKYKIRDKPLLIKSSVAIAFVVVVFFLHSLPELNSVSLSWTALLGATLLLLLADRPDLEPVLHRVEWSTLLFFAALFVLIEALAKLGLILYIGRLMEAVILTVDESSRLAVAILVTLWVTGTISAFVDNIPMTTMMIRVIVAIGTNPALNLPLTPLVWALLYGACLGAPYAAVDIAIGKWYERIGKVIETENIRSVFVYLFFSNGTLIGASANIVCAGVAEQHGYRVTFYRFFRLGFPIMIGHFLTASVYLIICHCAFTWH